MTASETTSPATAAEITRFRSRGFFPADFAAVESGKVYASGAFWSILRFPAFPAILPSMSLVAVIEIPFHANHADHHFCIALVDQDDNPMNMRVEGVFRSVPNIDHKYGAPSVSPVAVPIHALSIERPGDYSFTLTVDQAEIDRYSFRVVQIADLAMLAQLPDPTLPNAAG